MSATDTTATDTTGATAPAVARRPWFALAVEPRPHAALGTRVATIAACLLVALAGGALLLVASGYAPLDVYGDIVETSFGSRQAFSQTLIVTTPLILTSLAAAVAYRVRLYTVGADGQLVIGAICASGVALALGDDLGGLATIVLSLAAGVAGGALWASIAAVPRACLGTNEIISTLMLNFVALNLMTYLVLGSRSFWRDPVSAQPIGRQVPETALLPPFFDQADVGILLAVAVALGAWLLMQRTRWGYAVRVAGDSRRAAAYAGIDVRRTVVVVLCLSGALAGLAGAIQVTNVTQALDPDALNPGLGIGYAGIVVATLARLSLLGTVPVALLIGALLSAGPGLQLLGVPSAVVTVLQGLILLLVAGGHFFLSYRLRRVRPAVSGGAS